MYSRKTNILQDNCHSFHESGTCKNDNIRVVEWTSKTRCTRKVQSLIKKTYKVHIQYPKNLLAFIDNAHGLKCEMLPHRRKKEYYGET